MEILKKLYKCKNKKEILDFIENRIAECIKESNELNDEKIIGEFVDINPTGKIIFDKEEDTVFEETDVNIAWNQFIPPNVKIVFGFLYPKIRHDGYFYYMDNYDYLIEFIDEICKRKVTGEIDLLAAIHLFLMDYFINPLKENSREKCFKLVDRDLYYCYEPTIKHSISLFKKSSLARCTEFSATAQNIMSFFGMKTTYVHDNKHAYNIVEFEGEQNACIVDFTNGVFSYSLFNNNRTLMPFIGDTDCDSEELIEKLNNTDERYIFDEYIIITYKNFVAQQIVDEKRSYGGCGYTPETKKLILK